MTEKSSVEIFDENYAYIKEKIADAAKVSGRKPQDITLLAATKTVDVAVINHAIESGLQFIGENKVQEFLMKNDSYLPVHKHFIGHLQTNKVKDIVGKLELIQSVDSLHLAKEISKQSVKNGITTDILLEVNIGREESKSGFLCDDICENLKIIAQMDGIHIKGLMTIPPVCVNSEDNRKYFAKMNNLFVDIGAKKIDNSSMDILSMGMSDDYYTAISEGANLVRIGTALFGKRYY
ncbi:MAG: YggS family pyridoxal phosphate-dependent enzyme [Clostridia bacterium]|nr:YggS family pyridoxal phosphate-dependent enzyme [Clostridia bacterium]